VRFRNEDEVLPTVGGDAAEADDTSLSPLSSVSASLASSTTDNESVADICTVR